MSIPESLSCADFDDRVLRLIQSEEISPRYIGDLLPALVDVVFGGDYSNKRRDYADVILASIARLQDRGLLSKYEGRTVLE